MQRHEQAVYTCFTKQGTFWASTIVVQVPGNMYQRPVMWVQALPGFSHGEPPPATTLKNQENGDGTSSFPSPPKKSNKTCKSKKICKTIKTKTKSSTVKTVNVREQYLNILSTNAADLKQKAEDLKNKIKYFESSIFAVQETHFRKKGMFKMQDYHIFEAKRKNKEMGGSMLGVHVGLKPVLIQEYSEAFELIVVEITVAQNVMRVITGYGPQENWDKHLKTPFYNALEEEIAAGELEGRSIIIALDANAKLGSKYIPGDP